MQLLSCNEKYLPNSQTTSKWSCSKKNKKTTKKKQHSGCCYFKGKKSGMKEDFFLRTPKEFKTDVCYISRDCPLEVVSSPSK